MNSLINRQSIAIVLLFLALIVASFFFASPTEPVAYDLDSAHPQGLAALNWWLDDLGYDVERTGGLTFDLGQDGDEADLLFVFPNAQTYTDDEAATLLAWVEVGGTLVLMGPQPREVGLVDRFGVSVRDGGLFARDGEQQQPILPDADARNERFSEGVFLNLDDAPAAVSVFSIVDAGVDDGIEDSVDGTELPEEVADNVSGQSLRSTVAIQTRGEGTVWHVTPRYEPINGLLREPEVAQLVVAFLRTVPAGGTILFDTYHLFGADAEADGTIRTVNDWFTRSAPGRSLIFGGLLTLLFLLFQGRRLGPPLPLTTLPKRREAAEYVEAMAGLHRRSGQRKAVADYHKQRLKIALGRPLHLDPNIEDAAFVEQLQRAEHSLSADQLTEAIRLLRDLGDDPSEDALVRLVDDVDKWLQQ